MNKELLQEVIDLLLYDKNDFESKLKELVINHKENNQIRKVNKNVETFDLSKNV